MGKVGPAPKGHKRGKIRWLFFYIQPETAKILFFLALIALIGTVFGFAMILIGLFSIISYIGYYQQATQTDTTGTAGTYAALWSSNVIMYYMIYIVFLGILLFIEILTLIQCNKARYM